MTDADVVELNSKTVINLGERERTFYHSITEIRRTKKKNNNKKKTATTTSTYLYVSFDNSSNVDFVECFFFVSFRLDFYFTRLHHCSSRATYCCFFFAVIFFLFIQFKRHFIALRLILSLFRSLSIVDACFFHSTSFSFFAVFFFFFSFLSFSLADIFPLSLTCIPSFHVRRQESCRTYTELQHVWWHFEVARIIHSIYSVHS